MKADVHAIDAARSSGSAIGLVVAGAVLDWHAHHSPEIALLGAPMRPMKPLQFEPHWWPDEIGQLSTRGAQKGARYACFPEKRRLLIEREGRKSAYDTAHYIISGVAQHSSGERAFNGQHGPIVLDSLHRDAG